MCRFSILKNKINISFDVWECDKEGNFDLNDLQNLIKKNTRLMFMSHCSNTIGSFIPLEKVAKMARANNVYLGVDCTQSVGHEDLFLEDIGQLTLTRDV